MKKLLLTLAALLIALPASAQVPSTILVKDAAGANQTVGALPAGGQLPLPTGAASAANQSTVITTLSTMNGKMPALVSGAVPVAGTFWQATQPISAAALPLPALAATSTKQSDGSQKTQIVDGTGNVIASTSNNLNVQCANCSAGASAADKASFTSGTSVFGPAGGFFQTTATSNPLTTGQQGAFQVTANRALFVNLRDSSGTELVPATAANQASQITQETATAAVLGTTADAAYAGSGSATLNAILKGIYTVANTPVALPAGTNVIGHVIVDPTSKTQIVDGSGNVIASTSNNLNVQCANCSGSGASAADAASFTAGTSTFAPSGGFFQTTATTNPLTTGQQGLVQMTAQRAFFTNLRNASGTEIGTSTTPLSVTLANTGANATAVKVDNSAVTQPISGTITANIGTSGSLALDATLTGGTQQTKITDGTNVATVKAASTAAGATDKAVVVAVSPNNTIAATQSGTWNIGTVTTLPALVAGSATIGNVKITDGTNTGAVKAASTAAVAGDPAQVVAISPNNSVAITAAALPLPALASTSTKQSDGSQKTQIVDGSGNVIASTSNNLNVQCANCSGSGVSTGDEATFTAGTSLFAGGGGFFQTTATSNALTTGQQGMFQVTANRALFTNLRNAAGTEIGTSTTPVQVSLANTGANATAVKTDPSGVTSPVSAASLPLPTGAATSAKQAALGTAGTPSADVLTVQGATSMTALKVDGSAVTQPVNEAQINGVTPLMGNGTSGTGAQRVAIASDNSAVSGFGVGATGSAVPANAVLQGVSNGGNTTAIVGDPCQTNAHAWTPISVSTAATSVVVAGTSSKKTYVCGMMLMSAGTTNVGIVQGSGTTCGTSTLGLIGGATAATGPNLTAQVGFVIPTSGYASAATTVNANDVCLINGSAIQVSGYIVTAVQ